MQQQECLNQPRTEEQQAAADDTPNSPPTCAPISENNYIAVKAETFNVDSEQVLINTEIRRNLKNNGMQGIKQKNVTHEEVIQ